MLLTFWKKNSFRWKRARHLKSQKSPFDLNFKIIIKLITRLKLLNLNEWLQFSIKYN